MVTVVDAYDPAMTEQLVVGLSLVVIRVRDLETSRRFYESIGLVLRP